MDKIHLHTQHSRSWRDNRYVYPVISRRSRGLSIGINLNPDKVCNFDCVYCCVDRTTMSPARTVPEVDLAQLRAELRHLLAVAGSGELFARPPFDQTPAPLRRINDVAFSGDGEPTSYPNFLEACQLVAEEIAAAGQHETKIVLITNATLLARPSVATALSFLDQHNGQIWAKLDAGTDAYYHQIERTTIPLSRILANILAAGKVRPLLIQSLFLNFAKVPPTPSEIAAYVSRLTDLRAGGCQIKAIQIYTIARPTAESIVTPLSDVQVNEITAQVREAGFTAESFYGPT